MLGRLLEDRGLPEQCARRVAACLVDEAEPFVEVALLARYLCRAGALQERLGDASGSRTERGVALCCYGWKQPTAGVRGSVRIARGGLAIAAASALQGGFGEHPPANWALAHLGELLAPSRARVVVRRYHALFQLEQRKIRGARSERLFQQALR